MSYYGDLDKMLQTSGIYPADFGLEDADNDGLKDLLTHWYQEAKGIIDRHRRRDFLEEADNDPSEVSTVIHHVADRLVANMIALYQARRGSPVVRVGDYEIRMTDDRILTPDIERLLSMIPAGKAGKEGKSNVRVMTITGRTYTEQLEDQWNSA